MTTSKAVTVFACGNCGRHFDEKDEADIHCVCECGRLVEKESRRGYGVTDKCALCLSREGLAYSSRQVTELETQLAEAKESNEKRKAEHEKLKKELDT